MKKTIHSQRIEALEGRIAPAILVTGGNLLGGAGNPNTGEYSVANNALLYVKVTSGQAVVWFDGDTITGISVGPNVGLEITGNIYGDIVANLDSTGRLTDLDENPLNGLDGGKLLANNIASIKIRPLGSEDGDARNIVTGGSISGLNISGRVEGVYAGDGVYHPGDGIAVGDFVGSDIGKSGSYTFDVGFDVNPLTPGYDNFTLDKANALMTPGASINASTIGIGYELQVISGSGNPTNAVANPNTAGPAGGNIAGLTIVTAKTISATSGNPSYELIAGDGASGKVGGAGGSFTNLVEKSAKGVIFVRAGDGGDGSAGAGGAGGGVRGADFGSLSAIYNVIAGDGGSGTPGGAGGGATSVNFANISETSSLIQAGDLNGDGTDELVMLEASSGDFVVTFSDDDGATFDLLLQYTNDSSEPVYVVDGNGLASDLDIADINGDGTLDVIVTYSNSGTITAFLNNGAGVFWDFVEKKYFTKGFSYENNENFNAKYVEVIGDHFVVAAENKSKTRLVTVPFGPSAPATKVIASYSVSATAMASTEQGDAFVGFTNGTLVGVSTSGGVNPVGVLLGGSVVSLAVGDDGGTLAALSKDRKVAVFDLSTGANAALRTTLDFAGTAGKLLQAKFIPDADPDPTVFDRIVVSRFAATTSFDVYQPSSGGATYALATSENSGSALKQFTISEIADGGFGLAGVTGSANALGFSKNLAVFDNYPLPFNGKQVNITGGNGGNGIALAGKAGKGGIGGGLSSVNIDAVDIKLISGNGGNSEGGAAGAGGGISNGGTMTTLSGAVIVPAFKALETLRFTTGDGGNSTGTAAKAATGGAGGHFLGLKMELAEGRMDLFAGHGGDGNGGLGGGGGGFFNIRAVGNPASIRALAGSGGDTTGTAVKAGNGGGFSNFTYILQNEEATEVLEQAYTVQLTAGDGGASPGGFAGWGGGLITTTLNLDGSYRTYDGLDGDGKPIVDAHLDSTVMVVMTSGNGGNGVTGGKGGDVSGTRLSTIHDQVIPNIGIFIHYITAAVIAGDGGSGSTGDGGAGGNVNASVFTGVTFFDRDAPLGGTPLIVQAGAGGTGGNKGGAGGNVISLVAQNAPWSGGPYIQYNHLRAAEIYAGNGGDGGNSDGGAGGSLSGLTVGTSDYLFAVAGDGGAGGVAGGTLAKGGNGGQVATSTLAVVQQPTIIKTSGLIATAGNGGSGRALGGVGGALNALTIHIPISPSAPGAILTAGDGGLATGTGAFGGKGGDITGINNTKDIHAAISLIEAGNGGNAAAGTGGNGGNVSKIRVAGFIGRAFNNSTALGVFDNTAATFGAKIHTEITSAGIAQGLFVGRGGTGATAGLAGSVLTVQAEAIAAIGAAVDATGRFALAEKVTGVKASFIGYDQDGDGAFDTGNPGSTQPTDGFILAKALALVTGSRTGFVFSVI